MPHVVLNGNVTIESVFRKFEPLFVRDSSSILRTLAVFIERGSGSVLIECLFIDSQVKTVFLAMVSGREDGLVVRLYPKVEVKKTSCVKQVLAEIAKQLMKTYQELKLGETNLQDYLL
jgi:hypothetical protein